MSTVKNNRWLSVVTILLLAANIVTLILLWSGRQNEAPGKRPGRPGPVFEFLVRELTLNEQQRAAYAKLRDGHQADQRRMRDSIRKSKDALFELLKQPLVPDSLLQQYSRNAAVYEQQLDIITFRHFQQVRAICDEKQQVKFDKIIRDALGRMAVPGGPPPAAMP